MTLAEIIFFAVALAIVYLLLTPLQRYLEVRFKKIFRSVSSRSEKSVIDITDYRKKDKDQP